MRASVYASRSSLVATTAGRALRAAPCVVWLMAVWPMAATGAGATLGPQELVEQTNEELRAAVIRDREAIKKDPNRAINLVEGIILPHTDTTRIGQWVLGKYWRQATPQQRQQFIDGFRRLLLRTYAVRAADYTDVEITYMPLRSAVKEGDPITVRTQVTQPGKRPANVDYRLHQVDGAWKVYDVTADGISLVATFRASIDAEVHQHGIDGLITNLNAKNQSPIAPR